jgi:hypothetical protein
MQCIEPECIIGGATDEQKGNFTQVPNEVIEFFMNRQIFPGNSREYAIIFFLIRELQGWSYKTKPIELEDYVQGTGLARCHITTALKSLVTKHQVVVKHKLHGFRTPLYGFNEEMIGRIMVNKPKNYFKFKGKVVDLEKMRVLKSVPSEVTDLVLKKRQVKAIVAASLDSKDPFKDKEINSPIVLHRSTVPFTETYKIKSDLNGQIWDPGMSEVERRKRDQLLRHKHFCEENDLR